MGATGDGKTDDTAAIEKAITEGAKLKLPVSFPRGVYRVTRPLTLAGQSLSSSEPGGWNADNCPLPSLLIDHSSGPALTMKEGAAVHALAFVYQRKPRDSYPPTIQLSGVGLSITNTRIQYPDDAIISDGKSNIGRINIENVFIVAPRKIGVYITKTYDVPVLRNIEVWNNDQTMYPGPAFKFGHNDGMRASDLFAFNEGVGFSFVSTETGGFWGVLSNCSTDACSVGVRIEGDKPHTIGITGGFFWDHHMTIEIRNPKSHIRIANAELVSNGAPVIDGISCKSLLVTGCRFSRAFADPKITSANLDRIESVTLNGCLFEPYGPCIRIGKGVKLANISGNIFQPSPYQRIKNEAAKTAEIIISKNTGMKPEKAGAAKTSAQKSGQPRQSNQRFSTDISLRRGSFE